MSRDTPGAGATKQKPDDRTVRILGGVPGPTVSPLQTLLDEGLAAGLYSGAAAGIWTADRREVVATGRHAFGDDRAVDRDSLFDLASVSKTFTAAVLLRLVELGAVRLDEPVAGLRAVGGGAGSESITLRMLLSHTSGLPAVSFLWRDRPEVAPQDRLDLVLGTTLESEPGAEYRYSCLGYIAAASIAERATGESFAALLHDLVTQPLGLTSIGFGPVDTARAVATEHEPWAGRGLVRSEVHDETSWYLGGRTGNAGLFGTIDDVLDFAGTFVHGGLLADDTLSLTTTDQLPPQMAAGHGQGLGPRIRDREIFGDVDAFGHPGFTGTLWVAVPARGSVGVLLTNRVHPDRDRVDLAPFSRRFTAMVAAA